VEAARGLARRTLSEGGPDDAGRMEFAFRLCTARRPTAREVDILTRFNRRQLALYRDDRAAATALVAAGESGRPAAVDAAGLAAWTAVGSLLLNLDETITKG
jgi:hypothetical protein